MPIIKEPIMFAAQVIIEHLEEMDKRYHNADTIVVLPSTRNDDIGSLSAYSFWNMAKDKYIDISLDRMRGYLNVYKIENGVETRIMGTAKLFSPDAIMNKEYVTECIKVGKVIYKYLTDK